VHIFQTEPEVAVDWTKPNLVDGPWQVPVESVVDVLVYDDPAEHWHELYVANMGRYCYIDGHVLGHESCRIYRWAIFSSIAYFVL